MNKKNISPEYRDVIRNLLEAERGARELVNQAREKARIARGLQFSAQIYHNLGAYAVGVWDFNTDFSDISGTGNNGFNHEAVLVDHNVSQLKQVLGKTAQFNGVEYIEIPDSAGANTGLDGMHNFTIDFWFRVDNNNFSALIWKTQGYIIFGFYGAGGFCFSSFGNFDFKNAFAISLSFNSFFVYKKL